MAFNFSNTLFSLPNLFNQKKPDPKPGDPNFVGPVMPAATLPQPGSQGFVGPVQPPPLPGSANFIGPVKPTIPQSPLMGITKTATGSIGPDGKPVYDLFQNGKHLTSYPTGVNIDNIPLGQQPTGYTSKFAPPVIPQVLSGDQTPPPDLGTLGGASQGAQGATSTSATTIVTPEAQKAVDSANLAYQQSLKISPEELSTQADLDKLIESTKTAYRNTSDQAIPLEFITGQMASIERRATGLAEPLERKLSRMQAARTSSLESSKFALERADKALQAEKALAAPQAVGQGTEIVKYNPATGKYETVYTNAKEVAKPASAQEYEYAKTQGYAGTFTQYQNEDANRKRSVTNVNVGTPGAPSPEVQGWVDAIQSNKAKLSDVPAALKTAVAGAISGSTAEATELQKNAYTSAQDLLTKFQGGNKFAVGGSSLFGTLPGTQARDFKTRFDNLKALLSLDNVKYLKGQGQVSDAERKLLADASANLSLGQSESEFETSLKNVVSVLEKVVGSGSTAASSSTGGSTFVGPSGTTYNLPY